MTDPLNSRQPHTPRQPFSGDANRPTCSQPSEHNKGCPMHRYCALAVKARSAGPVTLVVEDHRDVEFGSGRRFGQWCFDALRMFFGPHQKVGFSVCDDRTLPIKNGDKWEVIVLPEHDKQGPHYYRQESLANEDALKAMSEFRKQQKQEARSRGTQIPQG